MRKQEDGERSGGGRGQVRRRRHQAARQTFGIAELTISFELTTSLSPDSHPTTLISPWEYDRIPGDQIHPR